MESAIFESIQIQYFIDNSYICFITTFTQNMSLIYIHIYDMMLLILYIEFMIK